MKTLILKTIPTDRQINTAFHQDEGIIVRTTEGAVYSFVPKGAVFDKARTLTGTYCRIENNTFVMDEYGQAELKRWDLDTPEPQGELILLDVE